MWKNNIIKIGIIALLFLYPILELTRLILIYPGWMVYDYRPITELVFMWSLFGIGLYLSTKKICWRKTV